MPTNIAHDLSRFLGMVKPHRPRLNQSLPKSAICLTHKLVADRKITLNNDNLKYLIKFENELINTYSQGKTIFDFTDSELAIVRDIAYKCPEELATSNAKAILMKLFLEEIGDCPEELETRKLQIHQPINITKISAAFLGDNYPDPARVTTKIDYYVPEGEGKIIISDIFGREVENFLLEEGENYLEIKLDKYNSGLYFYKMIIDNDVIGTKKFNVIK
ncbi:MAG: T9SS type A sorting domain-containing protein [Bacteroidales bacterium]|nr:T9SS type A sorting domain-containing protein [Bacteroidales bacterium]